MKAAEENNIPRERVVIFNPHGETAPEGFLQWKDLLKYGEEDWVRFDNIAVRMELLPRGFTVSWPNEQDVRAGMKFGISEVRLLLCQYFKSL